VKPASFVWALEARLALPGDQNRYFVQGGLAFSSTLCANYTSCPQSAEESHDDFPVPFSEGHFQVVSPVVTYPLGTAMGSVSVLPQQSCNLLFHLPLDRLDKDVGRGADDPGLQSTRAEPENALVSFEALGSIEIVRPVAAQRST